MRECLLMGHYSFSVTLYMKKKEMVYGRVLVYWIPYSFSITLYMQFKGYIGVSYKIGF